MKCIVAILVISLCSGCAIPQAPSPPKRPVAKERGNAVSRQKPAHVRTEELVKAYPVGRYVDPNDPNVMHERHTLYRREQSADWDYLPDQPNALPLGPVVAESNPSASYYVKTDAELMNAQQKAQADALAEQNRALQKRLAALQQSGAQSQAEIDRLKMQLASLPAPKPAPDPVTPAAAAPESSSRPWEDFSN